MKSYLLILLLPLFSRAQISSIEANGLGNIGIRSSLIDHIAASGKDYTRMSNSLFYSLALPELGVYNLVFEKRHQGKNYALGFQHFGPQHFQLSEIEIAYGMPLKKGLILGLKLGLQHQQIVEQAPQQQAHFALHWDYASADKWIIAGAIAHSRQAPENWQITQQMRYKATDDFRLYAQAELNSSRDSRWSFAMDYQVWQSLRLYQGLLYNKKSLDYRAGLGLSLKKWRFIFIWQYQRALGNREGLSIIYQW